MMKILLLSLNFPPELIGIGKYSGTMTEYLRQNGFEVRVVTAPPYYPQWKVFGGYSNWRYTREMWQGVPVWRVPLWVPRRVTTLTRILHLLSFGLACFPAMLGQLSWRPDVVLCVTPALFSAPAAWLVARMCGAKAWLHVQDFEMDAAFALGFFTDGKLMLRLARNIERWLLFRFDHISSISENMVRLLLQKGVQKERAYFFPNWVDVQSIYPLETPNPLRTEFGIGEEKKIVLYHGNMGYKQGLDTVIESARLLEDSAPDILFVLCGEGAERTHLETLANGLSNLIFVPLQPAEKLNELANLADIHILPQRKEAADLVMPSKLTTMLASGKPVIACVASGTQIERVVSPVGKILPPEDAQTLSTAILDLMRNPAERARLGASARHYACQFLSSEPILSEFASRLQN